MAYDGTYVRALALSEDQAQQAAVVQRATMAHVLALAGNTVTPPASSSVTVHTPDYVIAALEAVLANIVHQLQTQQQAKISFWTGSSWDNVLYHVDEGRLLARCPDLDMANGTGIQSQDPANDTADDTNTSDLIVLRFPDARTSRRFVVLVTIMLKCCELLQTNTVRTLRDVFYQIATSKGLVMGDLRFRVMGLVNDCQVSSTAIPSSVAEVRDIVSAAEFILMVEKDAVFQQLAMDNFHFRFPCILITGKGYPDLNTREFFHLLVETLNIPSFAVVDCDPHGIEILSVYRFGSRAMAFDAQRLAVPNLKWLGILPSDLLRFGIPMEAKLVMTERDKQKGRALLERAFIKETPGWYDEVTQLMRSGYKAEVECLNGTGNLRYLSGVYLPAKLCRGNWL